MSEADQNSLRSPWYEINSVFILFIPMKPPPQAIGARNLLKSMAKQRESQQQQLVGLIHEKKTQLERYRIQLQSLEKTEAEQRHFIDQFILQK